MMILDQHLQDEISTAATRLLWRTRLMRGERLPTRELFNIAQQEIDNFHAAGIEENPPSDVARFVRSADQWLTLNRGKLWKLAAAEEEAEKC